MNNKKEDDRWPLPNIEEILEDLNSSSIFTALDLFSVYWKTYWKIRMKERCKEIATFLRRFGTFKFEVCHSAL